MASIYYFDSETNPSKIVKNVELYGDRFVHVNWEDTESLVEPHTCNNVAVGSFVYFWGIRQRPRRHGDGHRIEV